MAATAARYGVRENDKLEAMEALALQCGEDS